MRLDARGGGVRVARRYRQKRYCRCDEVRKEGGMRSLACMPTWRAVKSRSSTVHLVAPLLTAAVVVSSRCDL